MHIKNSYQEMNMRINMGKDREGLEEGIGIKEERKVEGKQLLKLGYLQ